MSDAPRDVPATTPAAFDAVVNEIVAAIGELAIERQRLTGENWDLGCALDEARLHLADALSIIAEITYLHASPCGRTKTGMCVVHPGGDLPGGCLISRARTFVARHAPTLG